MNILRSIYTIFYGLVTAFEELIRPKGTAEQEMARLKSLIDDATRQNKDWLRQHPKPTSREQA